MTAFPPHWSPLDDPSALTALLELNHFTYFLGQGVPRINILSDIFVMCCFQLGIEIINDRIPSALVSAR